MDQGCPLIANIPHGLVNPEPLEDLARFAQQHNLFGALCGCGRVDPFPRQFRIQRHRAAIMDFHDASQAVSGDDHEAVMLQRLPGSRRVLTDGSAQNRR